MCDRAFFRVADYGNRCTLRWAQCGDSVPVEAPPRLGVRPSGLLWMEYWRLLNSNSDSFPG
jgi:hypothetical protein